METNKIYCMDNVEGMKNLPENSVELTLTSPPYYNAKEYSFYKTYQDYLDMLRRVFQEVYRITKPSRMVIVNISPVIVERESRAKQSYRIPIPFHFVPIMDSIGFEFLEDIIWEKPAGAAIGRNGKFFQIRKPVAYKPNLVAEYVLVFKKPAPFLIDKVLKNEPILDTDIEWTNIWKIQPETKSKHPAPFPLKLATNCITYYSYKGELVLDPFMGSGTTAVGAKILGRNYIGFEICQTYCDMAEERLTRKSTNH